MLQAVKDLGYRPSRKGAVAAQATGGGLKVSAATQQASLKKGKSGKIRIRLEPQAGAVGGVELTATAADTPITLSECENPGEVARATTVEVEAAVAEDAQPGAHELTVVVKAGDEQVRLRVPVYVE